MLRFRVNFIEQFFNRCVARSERNERALMRCDYIVKKIHQSKKACTYPKHALMQCPVNRHRLYFINCGRLSYQNCFSFRYISVFWAVLSGRTFKLSRFACKMTWFILRSTFNLPERAINFPQTHSIYRNVQSTFHRHIQFTGTCNQLSTGTFNLPGRIIILTKPWQFAFILPICSIVKISQNVFEILTTYCSVLNIYSILILE